MDRTNIYINSRNRSSGDVSNFVLNLTPSIRISSAAYTSSEIPFTFYATNNTNNQIQFTVGANTYLATISPGNYEITSYVDTVQTQMNALFPGFTVSYARETHKITINNSTNFTILATSSASRQLGVATTAAQSTTWTSQNAVDISGPKYLLLHSLALTNQKIIKSYVDSLPSDVVAKISIVGAPGDILIDNVNQNLLYRTPQLIDKIDIRLTDENGELIDLNGLDFSVSFSLN